MTSIALLFAAYTMAETWGPPATVFHDDKPCVTYRARVAGRQIAVEAKLEPGWHTFTMDNDKRAAAKLAGKKALSNDKPTQLLVEGAGPWMQPQPKDFSQPELRIFSWGYEGEALFVAPIQGASAPVKVHIKGQACTQTVCKNVDVVAEAAQVKAAALPVTSLIAVQ